MNSNTRKIAVLAALALILPMVAKASGTVPTGTAISVTINQSISSKDAKLGQAITGSVAKDVTSGGKVVIPRGSTAKLTVSSVQASGRLSTPGKLYLRLRSVTVNGKTYSLTTSSAGKRWAAKASVMPNSSAVGPVRAR